MKPRSRSGRSRIVRTTVARDGHGDIGERRATGNDQARELALTKVAAQSIEVDRNRLAPCDRGEAEADQNEAKETKRIEVIDWIEIDAIHLIGGVVAELTWPTTRA